MHFGTIKVTFVYLWFILICVNIAKVPNIMSEIVDPTSPLKEIGAMCFLRLLRTKWCLSASPAPALYRLKVLGISAYCTKGVMAGIITKCEVMNHMNHN